MNIQEACCLFASAIANSEFVEDVAKVTIRDDAELGNASVFHCDWPLAERGPNSSKNSRLITVQNNVRRNEGFP